MTKKNKFLLSIFGISSAVLILTITAFASISTASGYDKYKKALINTASNKKNYTANLNFRILEDGKEIFSSLNEVKNDGSDSVSTIGNIKSEISEKEIQTISQGSKTVYLGDDGKWHFFKNMGFFEGGNPFANLTPNQIKFIELLSDTLTGDTKNYVVTNGNNVSLTLSENQIPELSQFGLSSFIEIENKIAQTNNTLNINNKIIIDPVIQSFKFSATLGENNVVKDTLVTFEFTYKDENNLPHISTINSEIYFSNFGTTTPLKIDDDILKDATLNN